MIRGVAVEKLARHEFAEIASRQEALQTIFSSLLDIFYHPIFDFFQKNRLFQQPQDFSTAIRVSKDSLGRMQMRHRGELCSALRNTLDAKRCRNVNPSCVRSTGLWKALTYTFPHH